MENKYSAKKLNEFKKIIEDRLVLLKEDYIQTKDSIKGNDNSTSDTDGRSLKLFENDGDSMIKEELGLQAQRQVVFIKQLENALIRIANGSYGICRITGKLIPEQRLRSVPHCTTSIEAKLIEKKMLNS